MIDKIIDPSIAANAYSVSSNIKTTGETDGDSGDDGGVSFSSFLKDKATESLDTMRASETLSAKAISGDAELTEVVEAITAAEVTLQTVVAVRDRVISAYQEIMRMPI